MSRERFSFSPFPLILDFVNSFAPCLSAAHGPASVARVPTQYFISKQVKGLRNSRRVHLALTVSTLLLGDLLGRLLLPCHLLWSPGRLLGGPLAAAACCSARGPRAATTLLLTGSGAARAWGLVPWYVSGGPVLWGGKRGGLGGASYIQALVFPLFPSRGEDAPPLSGDPVSPPGAKRSRTASPMSKRLVGVGGFPTEHFHWSGRFALTPCGKAGTPSSPCRSP